VITFCMDFFIPVSIGLSPFFVKYKTGKWIFTGWLIEVPMDTDGV
jgi:hypothetical protein